MGIPAIMGTVLGVLAFIVQILVIVYGMGRLSQKLEDNNTARCSDIDSLSTKIDTLAVGVSNQGDEIRQTCMSIQTKQIDIAERVSRLEGKVDSL